MNVFLIPSWYPSESDPLAGIFFKEQAEALALHCPDINIGISVWGQNDEKLLLWSGKPLGSLRKLFSRKSKIQTQDHDRNNIKTYFSPKHTWTSKILEGNIENIIQANLFNLNAFEEEFGMADLIHAHVGYPAGYIAKILSERRGVPYVITEHMSPFPHKFFIHRNGELSPKLKSAYSEASKIIAVSNFLKEEMEKFHIENICVVPNLIKDEMFSGDLNAMDDEPFTFFCLARMVDSKGIDLLLRSFSKLKSPAVLRVGGDGEKSQNYMALAKELRIEAKVKWLGALDRAQAHKEFQNCHSFVLPSHHESMGVVYAEAMACGKPVIATKCGGPEFFINKSNGFLVPVNNELELLKAFESMIENYKSFDKEVIRNHCIEIFSPKTIINQLVAVYEEVINQ